MDKIKIIFLGGQDEMYKAMTAVEINGDIFVLECGIRLPDKTKPGIDYVVARYDYLVEHKDKVRGYFITHGHDSIFAGLPYIYDKVPAPIFCTKSTAIFIKGFCTHNNIDFKKLNICIVNASDDVTILNRRIRLFQTCTNVSCSYGLSINTDQGNIVYLSSAIVTNEMRTGFIYDKSKVATIASEKTLILLAESMAADIEGYCSPNHRLYSLVLKDLIGLEGRCFISIDAPDIFNISEYVGTAIRNGRKIIPYDESSAELLQNLQQLGVIAIKKENIASIGEVNRLRPDEVSIFITGFGNALNNKVSLLARQNNDDKIIFIKPTDNFIFANHVTYATEITATNALDDLYHNDCNIIVPPKKLFQRMHAHEEDMKSFISVFRPRYFVPVCAPFRQLLAAAKIGLELNVGLNHNNVFIVDNGDAIEFDAGFAKVIPHAVISGDVFIDGKAVGDLEGKIFDERQKFSDDGVIILGATISKSSRKIVAGPDIQARGLVFVKDSETLLRELNRLFVSTINNELAKENYSLAYIENAVKDIIYKAIARSLNKNPIIIPYIAEVE